MLSILISTCIFIFCVLAVIGSVAYYKGEPGVVEYIGNMSAKIKSKSKGHRFLKTTIEYVVIIGGLLLLVTNGLCNPYVAGLLLATCFQSTYIVMTHKTK